MWQHPPLSIIIFSNPLVHVMMVLVAFCVGRPPAGFVTFNVGFAHARGRAPFCLSGRMPCCLNSPT